MDVLAASEGLDAGRANGRETRVPQPAQLIRLERNELLELHVFGAEVLQEVGENALGHAHVC